MPGGDRRVVPSRGRVLTVAAIDLGLITGVIAWGLHTHAMEPTRAPIYALRTVLPFLGGWVVWGPLLGCYRARGMTSVHRGVPMTLVAWLAATVTGAAVRATPLVSGSAPWIFVAVVFGVGAVVLVPWRAIVALSARA